MRLKLLTLTLAMLYTVTGWCSNGDTFISLTIEGVEMTFVIISEDGKTCAVGRILGDGSYTTSSIDRLYSGKITIPETVNGYSVISIGTCAFMNCTNMTDVEIPSSVETIGSYAFSSCVSLKEVSIPEGVISLGFQAFYNCQKMKTLTLPSTLQSIGGSCFNWNETYSLTSIYSYIQRPFVVEDIFYLLTDSEAQDAEHRPYRNATLYVPKGSKKLYTSTAEWKRFTNIIEMEAVVVKDNVSLSQGICTFCSPFDLDFSGIDGLQAYIVSGFSPSTSSLILTKADHVPAGEGLILKGEVGDYEIPYGETDMVYSNLLKGVTTETEISPIENEYTNFILANGAHGVGFYTLSQSGSLSAGKAYLQLPTSSFDMSVKAFALIFEDGLSTHIYGLKDNIKGPVQYYDLQGRHVEKISKGIYIVNGRKVIIK